MKRDTKRLEIFPLTYEQLTKYIQADGSLENELGVTYYPRAIPPELAEAFTRTILPAVADQNNDYLFSTLWTIILKEKNVLIGDICFKGEPNENGEIEIGYGTYEAFQRNGYMTEAIKTLIEWAFLYKEVTSVIAETESGNIPSHRVLEKNGFKQYKSVDGMLWWRLDKK